MGKTTWRIAKVAIPVFLIIGLAIAAQLLRGQRDGLQDWQDKVVAAAQETSEPGSPPLNPDMVVQHIARLGHRAPAQARAPAAVVSPASVAHRAAAEAIRRNAPRAATRREIIAPGRSTGLTDAEWNQL